MEGVLLVMVSSILMGGDNGDSWANAAESFALGPAPPRVDLRSMLTKHIVRRSCALLDATARRRREAIAAGRWEAWRDDVRKAVRDALGPMPFGAEGGPLNVRHVSRHERPGYVLGNVLFESLPGLDVNASVYLPLEADWPPPWPAIVVPVGHDRQVEPIYQLPAQVFARRGYVAVVFDPPGMAGEKPLGNDHFRDGVRCYLTGQSSNRYFVIDALRCIDYLATRADVDLGNGVGMTGVSGGGMTTMSATLLDERITAAGPACCAVPLALHPVLDAYTPCPENLPYGRFAAYDDMDLLAAAMPTPTLLMAGAKDEVFTADMSEQIAVDVAASFKGAGYEDRFSFFMDAGGHAYSVAMALEFADWMDAWVRKTEVGSHEPETSDSHGAENGDSPNENRDCFTRVPEPGPSLFSASFSENDLEILPADMLACQPRQERNMFSVNRDVAVALRERRSAENVPKTESITADGKDGDSPGSLGLHGASSDCKRRNGDSPGLLPAFRCENGDSPGSLRSLGTVPVFGTVPVSAVSVVRARRSERASAWFHYVEEIMLEVESDIELPATYVYPAKENWKGPALLYFDERGRWCDLRAGGPLTRITRFLQKDAVGPALLAVDLRGWGETRPANTPYDLAGWAGRERWTAYVSAAMGDPILAMRIRDGLVALAYLRSRGEVDPARIVVGGRGLGGVVALHVAAIDGNAAAAYCTDGLASFECLALSEEYTWSPEAFLPGVLERYDIPELAAALSMPTLIVNPLGPAKQPLAQSDAEELYAAALKRGQAFQLHTGANEDAICLFVRDLTSD